MSTRKTMLIVILIAAALIGTIWVVANPNLPTNAGSATTPTDGNNVATQTIVNTSEKSLNQTPAIVPLVTPQNTNVVTPTTNTTTVAPPVKNVMPPSAPEPNATDNGSPPVERVVCSPTPDYILPVANLTGVRPERPCGWGAPENATVNCPCVVPNEPNGKMGNATITLDMVVYNADPNETYNLTLGHIQIGNGTVYLGENVSRTFNIEFPQYTVYYPLVINVVESVNGVSDGVAFMITHVNDGETYDFVLEV
jgi:hypothetical protein